MPLNKGLQKNHMFMRLVVIVFFCYQVWRCSLRVFTIKANVN